MVVGQDAQARTRGDSQHLVAIAFAQLVVPGAEEQEVVVGQPVQQLGGFGRLGFVDRQTAGSDGRRDLDHSLPHRAPVGHRAANVVEHTMQVLFDGGPVLLEGLTIDLHRDQRQQRPPLTGLVGRTVDRSALEVAGQHRVDHQVNADAQPAQLHGHRVDEERHVVAEDTNDGPPAAPTVDLDPGVDDLDGDRAGFPAGDHCEVVDRHTEQVLDRPLLEVVEIDMLVVETDGRLQLRPIRYGVMGVANQPIDNRFVAALYVTVGGHGPTVLPDSAAGLVTLAEAVQR